MICLQQSPVKFFPQIVSPQQLGCPRQVDDLLILHNLSSFGAPLEGFKGVRPNLLAWLPLQSLAVKKYFILHSLGGEKLLEKCRRNIFKRPERG